MIIKKKRKKIINNNKIDNNETGRSSEFIKKNQIQSK